MSLKEKLWRTAAGLGVALVTVSVGYLLIRPWHLRWGASDAEVAGAMPGDLDGGRWTRAITINAPPEQIWPWLLQWGQGRGGWYSYDWLENIFGFNIHSAERILPEYQNLALGDPICMAQGFCTSHVSVLEPNRWLSWQSRDEAGRPVWTFTLGLLRVDDAHTRLVVRESFDRAAMPPAAVAALEVPDVVMELKMLDTLKRRVEGSGPSGWVSAYEIAAWLAALLIGGVAGGQFITRRDGRQPLLIGSAAIIVLLALTFLFPPLWLRGLLDLGLLAGLAWSLWRSPAAAPQPALVPRHTG